MTDGGLLLDVLRGSLMLAPQKRFESAAHVLKMPLFSRQSLMNASQRANEMLRLQENMKALYSGANLPHNNLNYVAPEHTQPSMQAAYSGGSTASNLPQPQDFNHDGPHLLQQPGGRSNVSAWMTA
jgi:hypothetical protein